MELPRPLLLLGNALGAQPVDILFDVQWGVAFCTTREVNHPTLAFLSLLIGLLDHFLRHFEQRPVAHNEVAGRTFPHPAQGRGSLSLASTIFPVLAFPLFTIGIWCHTSFYIHFIGFSFIDENTCFHQSPAPRIFLEDRFLIG